MDIKNIDKYLKELSDLGFFAKYIKGISKDRIEISPFNLKRNKMAFFYNGKKTYSIEKLCKFCKDNNFEFWVREIPLRIDIYDQQERD